MPPAALPATHAKIGAEAVPAIRAPRGLHGAVVDEKCGMGEDGGADLLKPGLNFWVSIFAFFTFAPPGGWLLVGHSDFLSSFDFRPSTFDFLGVNFRVLHIRPPIPTVGCFSHRFSAFTNN